MEKKTAEARLAKIKKEFDLWVQEDYWERTKGGYCFNDFLEECVRGKMKGGGNMSERAEVIGYRVVGFFTSGAARCDCGAMEAIPAVVYIHWAGRIITSHSAVCMDCAMHKFTVLVT